ncbi:Protein kinase, putative [Hondaea fermentalgiana]|uniref:Protein kinase, putative n=1 Tax=Hondaea fermentalgiana TaxID=2315210 RepID=A0A2R5GW95_9STRA|nr:Protein kinase, putative [Hondaea fermentalgiana]|eukprot:GBG35102.1 Protein kinase, putative [Hondaea fermentalgiana]
MADMHELIKNGDLAGVQRAVQNDPALLDATRGSCTPLMWAVHPLSGGQPDTAQLLIDRGAKLDLQNNKGWTALMTACRYEQPDMAQLLIERGAKLDLQNDGGNSALMLACQQPSKAHHTASGLLRCIKLCYAAGADLDLRDKGRRDALALAKIFKRADAVAFLEFATMLEVARGMQGGSQQPRSVVAASLLSQDQTPLMQACKNGDLARAKKLMADGAQIDARDKLGLTPMIYACKFNQMGGDSLTLAKLLFEHSACLSSKSLGIEMALAHASPENRMELSPFLSFIHSLPLEHLHNNALRVMVVKVFDQGVCTLEEVRRLTPDHFKQLGISNEPDRLDFLRAFVDSEQIASLEVLAEKVSLARAKCKMEKPTLHPRLAEIFAEQLLREDPVAFLAGFDRQQTILRGTEQELIALQEAVKSNSKRVYERDKSRRDLIAGIRDALSGGIESQLDKVLADPGTKAVVDSCRSLWKETLQESAVVGDAVPPATFDQVQEATRDAIEAIKVWETRHDTSAACERTEAAIDALDESTKRLGIQTTFFMTLRHPSRTKYLAMELHNVQQSLKAELRTLTDVDPMADAPLKEVRRALARTISFYTCSVKIEVSRLQKAVKDLSSSLSRHVPGLSAPDTSHVTESMKNVRQNKRKREDLERDLERIREDANDGDAEAQAKIPGLEQELDQLGSVYKLDSELRKKRARVLKHAEEHYPELLRDQRWIGSLGINHSVPRELSTLGLWLTNAKRSDFETLAKLASKSGKSVLRVRDLSGRDFVLKSFHLADEEWSSRFYRQVAALAQIKSAYIVRIQGVFMQDAHQGCTLMPFYSGGDLASWIRDTPHADLATRRRIAIGLLSGLHDLHSQGFVHCDVKPENVFLAPGLSPVLGDFDGVQMHNVTMTQHMQATFKYMAPELRSGNVDRVESAVDLFSAGMVLADLFENKEVSDALQSLISSLQSADPTQRPTALEALRHDAFQVEPVKQASCAICLYIYPSA